MKALVKKIEGELFAVTQDIKVGDVVFGDDEGSPEDPGWGEFKDCTVTEVREETFMLSTNKRDGEDGLISFETSKENCFKVLGKISPSAIWVKDNDEIETQNTYFNERKGGLNIYQVRCSQCNTYH